MKNQAEAPMRKWNQLRKGASRTEMLVFFGLLLGWAMVQAFVLPKSNST